MIAKILNEADRLFDRLRDPLLLLSRLILVPFYFSASLDKIQDYSGTASSMESHGIPTFTLPLVILLEIGGSIFLALGLLTRLSCLALAIFSIAANYIYNHGSTEQVYQHLYMAEYTIVAAFVALMAVGPGKWALDAFRR
jgi:putative oxidoreductase